MISQTPARHRSATTLLALAFLVSAPAACGAAARTASGTTTTTHAASQFAKRMNSAGGFYVWVTQALGPGAGHAAGWALQFIGHAFEGKPPEFFHDWRFLLVGARWWVAKIRGKV